ncbi:MAG: DNA primase [Candidatus Omnitrophica bacterium]|nr:DNA primase [Candidatus Omnitrophota bacterium]
MIGRIPDNILEDILSRVDIVEIISGYIPLKKAGRNFRACCPFHHEKTPSFMVSPDRQIYHCFGCGESGNAFKFLMRHERMDFPEAVQLLARKSGVILPETKSSDNGANSISTELFKINELAALFFEANLNSQLGAKAKDYFLKRGVKQETLKLFKLGVTFDKWDALITYLRNKSINLSLIEKAGLILPKENGGYYDRFRNRIIFPIFDIRSRVLAFGGRVLDNSTPKYLNSPETPVYVKGRNLYGLNLAKDSIRENDFVVIVEGYMDFIMPFQEGFKNIIASCGTALTNEQARLLKRYTNKVVMVYDGDKAGELASLRSLDIFIEEGMDVKVVILPQGHDPDSFVLKEGVAKFREVVLNAYNLFDYKLKILRNRHNIKEAEGKRDVALEMLLTINKFKNSIIKAEYINRLSEEIGIGEEHILEELGKIKAPASRFEPVKEVSKRNLQINPTERLLIKLMLEEKNLIDKLRNTLAPDDFQDQRVSKIVSTMFELFEKGKNIETSSLMQHFNDVDIDQILCESLFLPELSMDSKEKVADDCVKRLKEEKVKLKKKNLHNEIARAQKLGDEQRLSELTEEFHNLIKKFN